MQPWFLFWQLSCSVTTATTAECYNDTQCGDRGVCISGICTEVSCRDNEDCELREICQAGECVSGCLSTADCLSGESCLDGICQAGFPCRTAQLDCPYGQDCIEGSCRQTDFPFCQPCDFSAWQDSPNGERECIIYSYTLEESCLWEQTECSGDLSCYPADQIGAVEEGFCIESYFFRPCRLDSDCPRPFTCKEDVYQDGSEVGVCWADCPFWRERGVF